MRQLFVVVRGIADDLPSKNSASENWGPHVAVIATKEDRGHEERAIQEKNTAQTRFRSGRRTHGVDQAVPPCVPQCSLPSR
jgi:hypothetical protein